MDLHLHTYYSDGSESPEDLVARAHSMGLQTIAITDHDGIGALPRGARAAEALGLHLVPGLEFSAELYLDDLADPTEIHTMHILGYFIDPAAPALARRMEDIIRKRNDRNDRICRAFEQKGILLKPEDLLNSSGGGFVGKRSFAEALVAKGLAGSVTEVFASEDLMGDPIIRSIHKEKTPARKAVELIHQAGGLAFLAHPFQLGYPGLVDAPEGFRQRLALVIARLKELGLDGLESYYPTHDPDMTRFLLDRADEQGLLSSIGSDDHGPGVRKVKKMGSFQVQADPARLAWVEERLRG